MSEAPRDHVAIDVGYHDHDPSVTDLEAMMSDLNMNPSASSSSSRHCIFRIPNNLLSHNENAYVPEAFSIGPYHYAKQHHKSTAQKIKLRYLHGLISRLSSAGITLRDIADTIRGIEEEARACYAEPVDMCVDEFVKVLVLDGCFIVELFRKNAYEDLRGDNDNDPVFSTSCVLQFLYHDLILLENQIPWLVLDRLFDMTNVINPNKYYKSLTRLAIDFFNNIFHFSPPSILPLLTNKEFESKHILSLLRNSLVSSSEKAKDKNWGWQRLPPVTALDEMGMKFKKGREGVSILDIEFKDGVLVIPLLFFQDMTTECLFRNLIGLEQCLPNCASVITGFVTLMADLIKTTKDVEILCNNGVVDSWLNIEETTAIFYRLYQGTFLKDNYYLGLTNEVFKYYYWKRNHFQRRWPTYRRELKREYFYNPWALISSIAGVVLLVLTFLQTVFTITSSK
ncbi:hypothetical protein TIFTF001_035478 [Ficus carica]|uniref:Uncharacterized protein n=1 Tax=Ficus carica TaxID=3494 RepID=A0AA88E1P5_FICCA|nr:hypothetical protein TIFTF001_035478 [Ficus carica]